MHSGEKIQKVIPRTSTPQVLATTIVSSTTPPPGLKNSTLSSGGNNDTDPNALLIDQEMYFKYNVTNNEYGGSKPYNCEDCPMQKLQHYAGLYICKYTHMRYILV